MATRHHLQKTVRIAPLADDQRKFFPKRWSLLINITLETRWGKQQNQTTKLSKESQKALQKERYGDVVQPLQPPHTPPQFRWLHRAVWSPWHRAVNVPDRRALDWNTTYHLQQLGSIGHLIFDLGLTPIPWAVYPTKVHFPNLWKHISRTLISYLPVMSHSQLTYRS